MTTVTIGVTKNGFTRNVTVLASRLIWAEIASIVLTFALGYFIGRM
jgi:hypothetical protein